MSGRTEVTAVRSGIVALLALIAILFVAGRAASGGAGHYPDLIAETPGASHLEIDVWPVGDPADPEDCLAAHQGDCRLLMQFDGFVSNVGLGPIHIAGNPQLSGGDPYQVAQLILDDNDEVVATFFLETAGPDPAIAYETTDGHDHFHLMEIMEYSLWDENKSIQVTAGDKVGFCLFDVDPIPGVTGPPEPGVYTGGNFCAAGNPATTVLEMGTSEGWRDVYSFTLPLQWIDVTDVAPGDYYLAARADPRDWIQEVDEANNGYEFGAHFATVPGHVAQDLDVQLLVAGLVDLAVQTFTTKIDEDPEDFRDPDLAECAGSGGDGYLCAQNNVSYPKGTLRFTVESLPRHGLLTDGGSSVSVGTPFVSSALTYTPADGFSGCDSFTYSAADSGSPFPLNPVVAAASIAIANTKPDLLNPGDRASVAGEFAGVSVVIFDADGHDVVLSASGLPPGIEVSGNAFTGTPLIPGTYQVVATADDGAGCTDVETFEWVVGGVLVFPFADVSATHIFAEDITWVYALGISFGCGNGTDFCPGENASRGQVASFLTRAFRLVDGIGANFFTDDDGSVHEDNIDRLAFAEVTNGCGARVYCPTDDLSRAQFASLVIRALETLSDADFGAAAGLDFFTDDNGSVHEANIDKLRYGEITMGCQADLYCPEATLTRGQLAALLHRALG